MYEWDEAKRLANLEKHKLDFIDSCLLFDGRPVAHVPAKTETEERTLSIGQINGKFYTVVWTQRGYARRIISFRRSRHEEEELYQTLYGG